MSHPGHQGVHRRLAQPALVWDAPDAFQPVTEYLHPCRRGQLAYVWRTTATAEVYQCAGCGALGVCVVCLAQLDKTLPADAVPVLCRTHGALDDEEIAITVGRPSQSPSLRPSSVLRSKSSPGERDYTRVRRGPTETDTGDTSLSQPTLF